MPKPKKGEKKEDFISRCMGSKEMKSEFSDQKQRTAVCYGYWKDRNKSKGMQQVTLLTKAEFLGYVEGEIKDTILVKFKLCHANRNANGDYFTYDELLKTYRTAESKAITYGHNKTYAIGYISKSVFIDTKDKKAYVTAEGKEAISEDLSEYGYIENEDSYVYCEGVIWKNRFPDETEEIRQDFEDGNLFFSMEAYFVKCECSVCHVIFNAADEYCEHLDNRYSDVHCSRILIDCTFAGVAKVTHPADKEAVGLSAATKFTLADLIPDDKFDSNILSVLTQLTLEEC